MMKSAAYLVLALVILATASCSKSINNDPAGSWTFQSVAYTAGICEGASVGSLTAVCTSGNYTSYILIFFYDSLPAVSGTYTVISSNPASFTALGPGQLYLQMGIDSGTNKYFSTGGNGMEKVNVTVSNNKVKVSGAGIVMANYFNPPDSAPVTLNITQTQ